MITKIFQGPKQIVEAQLASYTSTLSTLFSIYLSTCNAASFDGGKQKVKYVTAVVAHPAED